VEGNVSEETAKPVRTIGIIGGTGKEGKGLAYRWLKAGYRVLIGSRQIEKAQTAADELRELANAGENIAGVTNSDAALKADLAVITVPYSAHRPTLEGLKDALAGKILVDVTVPLVPPKVSKVQMPPAGSAAQEAQEILGEGVTVVAAFQNVSYERLLHDADIGCDVLVTGSSKAARQQVLELIKAGGMVGFDAGPIENSVVVEGLTSVLIGINRQFGVQSAGIKIIGIPSEPAS
jgi:8-hydroxy-5-deazaflavin:NADPH oxidoreductase